MTRTNIIEANFSEHLQTLESAKKPSFGFIEKASTLITQCLANDGTVMWCGNGGSASDSQHLAAELVGRYKFDRRPLRSIALNTDTSVLTCVANDYSFEKIFSRQLEALAKPGDLLIAISTSGNSKNILRALEASKKIGVTTLALLGNDGGKAAGLSDHSLIIPSNSTARIQEVHILVGHILCEIIEAELCVE